MATHTHTHTHTHSHIHQYTLTLSHTSIHARQHRIHVSSSTCTHTFMHTDICSNLLSTFWSVPTPKQSPSYTVNSLLPYIVYIDKNTDYIYSSRIISFLFV